MSLTSEQIQERVRDSVCSCLGLVEGDVNLNSKLIDDLEADSLDLVEILMDVEAEFEIEIEDEDAEKWETVIDICVTVARVIGEQKKPDPPPSVMIAEHSDVRRPINHG